jgi:hypothetical protein
MSVLPKPFSASDQIIKSVFKGEPSIFSAEDLNRQIDVITEAIKTGAGSIGLIRSGWDATLDSYVFVEDGIWDTTITITATGDAVVYAKGVVITVPEGTFTYQVEDRTVVVYLIAKKVLVTFADDPVLSGIASSEFPVPVSSSDTYRYEQSRIELIGYGLNPVLAEGEEIVGILASLYVYKECMEDLSEFEEVRLRHNAVTF